MKMHIFFEITICISVKKLSCRIDAAEGVEDEPQAESNAAAESRNTADEIECCGGVEEGRGRTRMLRRSRRRPRTDSNTAAESKKTAGGLEHYGGVEEDRWRS